MNSIIKIAICTWGCLVFAIIPTNAQEISPDPTIWVDTWVSCTPTQNPIPDYGVGHWIQYDLGTVRRLSKTWVWNTNNPQKLDQGFNKVKVDYSIDGTIWNHWGEMNFPKGTGETIYSGFPGPNMVDLNARYVVLTAVSNHGDASCTGIAEVKFNLLPDKVGYAEYDTYACKDFAREINHIVDGTSAAINWTAARDRNVYRISYKPVSGGVAQLAFSETPSLTLEDLQPNTEYEYFIGVACLDEEIEWSEVQYLSTSTLTSNEESITAANDVIQLAPNPSDGSFAVSYFASQSEQLTLTLVDVQGREIYHTSTWIRKGPNVVPIDLPSQVHGLYFLRLSTQSIEQDHTLKVLVQ